MNVAPVAAGCSAFARVAHSSWVPSRPRPSAAYTRCSAWPCGGSVITPVLNVHVQLGTSRRSNEQPAEPHGSDADVRARASRWSKKAPLGKEPKERAHLIFAGGDAAASAGTAIADLGPGPIRPKNSALANWNWRVGIEGGKANGRAALGSQSTGHAELSFRSRSSPGTDRRQPGPRSPASAVQPAEGKPSSKKRKRLF